VFEKKKGHRGLRIPKSRAEIIFRFCHRKERKGKENVCFFIPPYFLYHPFITCPPKMKKNNLHHFLNFVFPF
jgi:hypothetical protein